MTAPNRTPPFVPGSWAGRVHGIDMVYSFKDHKKVDIDSLMGTMNCEYEFDDSKMPCTIDFVSQSVGRTLLGYYQYDKAKQELILYTPQGVPTLERPPIERCDKMVLKPGSMPPLDAKVAAMSDRDRALNVLRESARLLNSADSFEEVAMQLMQTPAQFGFTPSRMEEFEDSDDPELQQAQAEMQAAIQRVKDKTPRKTVLGMPIVSGGAGSGGGLGDSMAFSTDSLSSSLGSLPAAGAGAGAGSAGRAGGAGAGAGADSKAGTPATGSKSASRTAGSSSSSGKKKKARASTGGSGSASSSPEKKKGKKSRRSTGKDKDAADKEDESGVTKWVVGAVAVVAVGVGAFFGIRALSKRR